MAKWATMGHSLTKGGAPQPKRTNPVYTGEHRQFVQERYEAGLSPMEISRMFFRKFGIQPSVTTVRNWLGFK